MAQITTQGATGILCPLPDPTRNIRLLKAVSLGEGQRLEFELSTHHIAQLPSYHAISYVWGSQKELHTISVNQQSYAVRSNCRHALLQALRYGGSQYYWIDAICIDQGNTDEKSSQVAMMGDIFDKATKVLSCVGEHENDSESLMNMLATIPEGLVGDEWPGKELDSKVLGWLLERPMEGVRSFIEGLTTMLLRPYFTRVWILQEVFRKQSRTIVCCGHQVVSFQALFVSKRALYHSRWEGELPYDDGLAELWASYADYGFPSRCSSFLIDVSFSGQRASNAAKGSTTKDGKDGLEEVLHMASSFDCTDVRDRIYGTLPLIDWESQKPIVPDYGSSRFELALQVLRHGWLCGKFGTLTRIATLTETFKLFQQDADSNQFQETASTILSKFQETRSSRYQGQDHAHSRYRRLDTVWRAFPAKDAISVRQGKNSFMDTGHHIIFITNQPDTDDEYEPKNAGSAPMSFHKRPGAGIGEASVVRDDVDHQNTDQILVISINAISRRALPIRALHLGRRADASRYNKTHRIPQSYDLYLVAEDALLLGILIASMERVSERELLGFLEKLNSANHLFSSYARAS